MAWKYVEPMPEGEGEKVHSSVLVLKRSQRGSGDVWSPFVIGARQERPRLPYLWWEQVLREMLTC